MKKVEVKKPKNMKLRIILFVFFFALAIFAFVSYFKSNQVEEGWMQIEVTATNDIYDPNFILMYYLDDSSSTTVREKNAQITKLFNNKLASYHQLLDCYDTYTTVFNIATINKNVGKEVLVDKQLIPILEDAYNKTLENKGYSLFAGAINYAWDSIFIRDVDNQYNHDPLNDSIMYQTITEITALINAKSTFSLEIDKVKGSVKLTATDEYLQLVDELFDGISNVPILDLGILKESYMIELIGDSLIEEGYQKGYIESVYGYLYALGTTPTGNYELYVRDQLEGYLENVVVMQQNGDLKSSTVYPLSCFEAGFSYYDITVDDVTYTRNKYIDYRTGYSNTNRIIDNCVVASTKNVKICDLAYYNYLLNIASREEIQSIIHGLSNDYTAVCLTVDNIIYIDNNSLQNNVVTFKEGYDIQKVN